MSQVRLPRTEPSTELITAHKVNNCDAHAALQAGDFSALPKHRARDSHGPCCAADSRKLGMECVREKPTHGVAPYGMPRTVSNSIYGAIRVR